MPDGWDAKTLGDLFEEVKSAAVENPAKYPLLTVKLHAKGVIASGKSPNETSGGRKHYERRTGEILVGRQNFHRRCVGKVPEDLEGYVTSNAITALRPLPGIDPDFALLLIQSEETARSAELFMSGTGQKEISLRNLLQIPVTLPPIHEQRRICDLIAAVNDLIDSARVVVEATLYEELLTDFMLRTDHRSPLSAVLSQASKSQPVDPELGYRIVGVQRSGVGFIDRGIVKGSEMAYSRLWQVGVDQLVYRKLTAWEGPISVADESVAGGWVSSEFPVFDVEATKLLPGLLRHMCRWPGLWKAMEERLVGSVHRRKRLNPKQLLELEVPVPSTLDEQMQILGVLEAVWEDRAAAEQLLESAEGLQLKLLSALLSGEHEIPSTYDELMAFAA